MVDAISPVGLAPVPAARPEAARVAGDFESVFLTRVVDEMLATSRGMFGDGPADGAWRGVMARAIADGIVRDGGVGLAPGVESTIAAYGAAQGGGR
jgi:hypothetical protein